MASALDQLVEALNQLSSNDANVPLAPWVVAARLAGSLAVGLLLATVYSRTHTGKQFRIGIAQAIVMLCMGGALIWLVVGNSLVRAFGLAGTIGLIRYRTIVRDPKDTTILLFAMVIGMACGLGAFSAAFIGGVFVATTLYLMHRFQLFKPPPSAANPNVLDFLGVPPTIDKPTPKPPQRE